MNTLDEILQNRVMAAVNSSMAITEHVRQAKEDIKAYDEHHQVAALTLGHLQAMVFQASLQNEKLYAHLVEIENMIQEAK